MRRRTKTKTNSKWLLAFGTLLLSISAWGQGMTTGVLSPPANVRPPELKNVGIEQRLNQQLSLIHIYDRRCARGTDGALRGLAL